MKGVIDYTGKGQAWAYPRVISDGGEIFFIHSESDRSKAVRERRLKSTSPASIPNYEWNHGEEVEFEIVDNKALVK